tara:strand:+ start:68 stop:322 length:255 start_codon:yes stop_codon:yes gene_type:complete
MDIDYDASIVTRIAEVMTLETQTKVHEDATVKTIILAVSPYSKKEQAELSEKLLCQYYLGYLDIDIDLSGIEGPVYNFNMNKPS